VKNTHHVALVGDFNPAVRAHVAIPKALQLAGNGLSSEVEWIHTSKLNGEMDALLRGFDGIWCVPACPYENMQGALNAIRFARERKIPFLGTCGGFQHALIEYARNVRNFPLADHEEVNPSAELALISRLSCSLVGAKGSIRLKPGTRAAQIYGSPESTEEYHCNYGLNPKLEPMIGTGPLKISATDEAGQARVIELEGHTFFFGTLFQPELTALNQRAHPLVIAFVQAMARHAGG
jgi:CTP synthase (UTP-ammonia lyase)